MKKVFLKGVLSFLAIFISSFSVLSLASASSFEENTETGSVTSHATCIVNWEEVDCEKMAEDVGNVVGAGLKVVGVGLLVGLVSFIFWIMMLIHAFSNPIADKGVWILVLFLVPFGFLIYYFVVKRNYVSVPASTINPPQQ